MHARILYLLIFLFTTGSFVSGNNDYRVIRGERPPIHYERIDADAWEKGVLVIKFNRIVEDHLESNTFFTDKDGIIRFNLESIDRLNEQYEVRAAQQHFRNPALRNTFTDRHRAWGFHLWYRLELDEDVDIVSLIREYESLPEVEIAEPEFKKVLIGSHDPEDFKILELNNDKSRDAWIPNDPQFSNQWHYHNTGQQNGTPGADISLLEAWELQKGDSAVIVAIIDGGIDYNHVDLAGNMWPEIGFNFVNNTPNIEPHNHGTHVAGTIAAVTNNNVGVAGIAGGSGANDGVRLMSCQVFAASSNGGFHLAPVYAADNGAAISQNSWGYTAPNVYDQNVLDAIDYFNINGGGEAMDGGITIFAAGNSNSSSAYYPGFYSGAFSVAATNNQDAKSWYSNFGPWIDISAPGGETNTVTERGVLSTLNGNQYGYYQGTSMACPHVSGVVALMLSSVYGEFSPEDVVDILLNTSDNHYGANPGFIGQLGAGRVNAYHAVALAELYLTLPSNPSNFVAEGVSDTQIDLSWQLNDDGNDIMLAWSPNGNFGIPQEGDSFHTGDTIPGGGIVLYKGSDTIFEHTELNAATLYYYKLWTVVEDTVFSLGRSASTHTQCGITQLPVVEPFNGPDFPYCWIFPNGQGNWRTTTVRGNPAPAVEFNWSPSVTNYSFPLESPPLDGNIPGNAIALEFDLWLNNFSTNTTEYMIIQVYNGEEWIDVMTFDNTQGDIPWDTYMVDITEHALDKTFMVRFNATGANSFNLNYWVLDNFTVYSFSCPQPSGLAAEDITSESVVINWTAVGDEVQWDLVWGNPGFDPYTQGTVVSGITETTYLLEGLNTFTSYQAYVRADCGEDDTSLWTGPLSFTTLATCPAPVNLTVSQVTSNSAFVNWDAVGSETIWQLAWGPPGFNPDNSGTFVDGLLETEYFLDELEGITSYDVYVRAFCDVDDESLWLGPASFTTICDIFTLPFAEDFSGNSVDCWSFPQGQGNWGFGNSYPPPSSQSGTPHATFNWSPSRVGYSFSLTSPLMDAVNPVDGVKVDYVLFLNNYNNANLEQMSVEYKAFEDDEWILLENYTNEGLGSGNLEFVEEGLELPGMQGMQFQLRFRAHGQNSFSINGWSVDDVNFYQEFSQCYPPDALSVDNITTNSAKLNWVGTGGESMWDILWGEAGFDPSTDGVLVESIVEKPYLLDNLEQNTAYEFYVRAVCSAELLSEWAGPEGFTTEIATYTMTITYEGPGMTDPEGEVIVEHGSDLTIQLDHVEGGHIYDVTLDGESVLDQVVDYQIIIEDITSGHDIHAVFALNQYEIELSVNPSHGGTVIGAGTYEHYSEVTIQAIPAENFIFMNWTEDDYVWSEEEEFVLEVMGPHHLVANFQEETSVELIPGLSEILIYPNPAQDKLWIEFIHPGTEEVKIALYSIHGQKVREKTVATGSESKIAFDLEGLQPGVYMVNFNNSSLIRKVIIN
ncbi:MAG: T9SS C-terminal target domain-containing protein [Bacteroidetes bacterium]|nr:MAG: T9SS C-terminal target domain-containing protein [Bacteroidota bacterium]